MILTCIICLSFLNRLTLVTIIRWYWLCLGHNTTDRLNLFWFCIDPWDLSFLIKFFNVSIVVERSSISWDQALPIIRVDHNSLSFPMLISPVESWLLSRFKFLFMLGVSQFILKWFDLLPIILLYLIWSLPLLFNNGCQSLDIILKLWCLGISSLEYTFHLNTWPLMFIKRTLHLIILSHYLGIVEL